MFRIEVVGCGLARRSGGSRHGKESFDCVRWRFCVFQNVSSVKNAMLLSLHVNVLVCSALLNLVLMTVDLATRTQKV